MAHLHKQGELGNMEKYTKAELIDLLNRQQNILRNGKFLQKLPDKGKKIQTFAEKLQLLIKEREQIDQTAELFEKMRIVPKDSVLDDQLDSDDEEGDMRENNDDSCLRDDKTFERTSASESKMPGNQEEGTIKKESLFKKRTSSQKGNEPGNPFLKPQEQKREVFRPYKTLHSNKLPDDLPKPEPLPTRMKSPFPRDKVEEISAVAPPRLRHVEGSKLVDMEESIVLEQEQQKKYEELYAKQAAERLAQRLNIKMEPYLPNQEDLVYREDESDDSDSDSAAEENEILED